MELITGLGTAILIFILGCIAGAKIEEESLRERYHKYPERLEADYQDWKAKKEKK